MPRPELRWAGRTARAVPASGGGAPSAPSQVTSITVDAGATVSWVNPGSGAAATSYTVTPYIAGSPQSGTTVGAPATFAAVTGLTNATSYTFTVKANNGAGSSAESAQSGANTPRVNLIFGDEFNGTILDPAWQALTRDSDQSNSETAYYKPQQVALDGSGNLLITLANQGITAPGYNDANPPTYAGSNVTRSYTSGMVQQAWPGAKASGAGQAYNSGNFTQRGFNFFYATVQVSAKMPNLPGGGWPAIWMLGADCEQANPLNPDNVAAGGLTCAWSGAGSEEIDLCDYASAGSIGGYNANLFNASSGFSGGVTVTNADTSYHTYEIDWAAGTLTWKLDGATVAGPFTTGIPAGPLFLIMNVSAHVGAVTDFTVPSMIVDWVRIFHN